MKKRLGRRLATVSLMASVAMMFVLSGTFIPGNVSMNAAASYPHTYDGDPYVRLSTGWNLVNFLGTTSGLESHDLFEMERDPVTRELFGLDMKHVIVTVALDVNFDRDQEYNQTEELDTDDLGSPDHWEVHGTSFNILPNFAYWILCAFNCYVYVPGTVQSYYEFDLQSGHWNAVGVMGEDAFWDDANDQYRHAHDMQFHIFYASNNSYYNGNFRLMEYYNPSDGPNDPWMVPGVDWEQVLDWGVYNPALNSLWFFFDHGICHMNASRTSNFHICEPTFQDHVGLYLWIPNGEPDLHWRFWPYDGDSNSPDYSYPD